MFKAVLLGEAGVGKSSIFLRLKENVFGERLQPTVGIESCSKVVRIDNQTITVSTVYLHDIRVQARTQTFSMGGA